MLRGHFQNDVMIWKHVPHHRPLVYWINLSPVGSANYAGLWSFLLWTSCWIIRKVTDDSRGNAVHVTSLWWVKLQYIPRNVHTVFALLCFVVVIHWLIFPISIRLTSLALWQSNDCPSASKATLMNMDKYFMWIHYERLHNHNKAKHNKTVCIFLGIYCISRSSLWSACVDRYVINFIRTSTGECTCVHPCKRIYIPMR